MSDKPDSTVFYLAVNLPEKTANKSKQVKSCIRSAFVHREEYGEFRVMQSGRYHAERIHYGKTHDLGEGISLRIFLGKSQNLLFREIHEKATTLWKSYVV